MSLAAPLIWNTVLVPLGLGLLGFVEPCSIGSSLLFLKMVEGQPASTKLAQAIVFMTTRAVFIGLLGIVAALVGTVFIDFQKAGWVILGGLYMVLGVAYLTGRAKWFMRTLGPGLGRSSTLRETAALAVLFGLNIPACAAPLLAALLGAAVIGGPRQAIQGFVTLGLFGLALSVPLAVALLWEPARRALDWLAAMSRRVPIIVGVVFVGLGAWSIYSGVFTPSPPF